MRRPKMVGGWGWGSRGRGVNGLSGWKGYGLEEV